MQRRRVGSSGLIVSRLGLGTLTWGDGTDLGTASAQLSAFTDAGGTLVETCDAYAGGESQRLLGRVLVTNRRARPADDRRTDDPARGRRRPRRPAGRAGRHAGPDRHRPPGSVAAAGRSGSGRVRCRWKKRSPRSRSRCCPAERATPGWSPRAAGSWPPPWSGHARSARSACRSRRRSSTRCWPARWRPELIAAAEFHGVGLLAWAPLGRGVLTGKYLAGTPADSRAASAALAPYVEARRTERSARIVHAVLTAADGLGTSPLAVALAWVRDRRGSPLPSSARATPPSSRPRWPPSHSRSPLRSPPRWTTSAAQLRPLFGRRPGTLRRARGPVRPPRGLVAPPPRAYGVGIHPEFIRTSGRNARPGGALR